MRGQIFVVDLMLALVIIVLAIGAVTQVWDYHLQQTAATVEHAKMQQIAIDAAAVQYYRGDDYAAPNNTFWGIHEKRLPPLDTCVPDVPDPQPESGAYSIGYNISKAPIPGWTCIGSTRGTAADKVEVFVCRRA